MILQHHLSTDNTKQAPNDSSAQKTEKLKRPEIESGCSDEEWIYFTDKWSGYKEHCGLKVNELFSQLVECCNDHLARDLHWNTGGGYRTFDEVKLLVEIKKLAVSEQNKLVNIATLLNMIQEENETIRTPINFQYSQLQQLRKQIHI